MSAALYHATILDHDRHPRCAGPLPGATHEATLDNPLCGDVVTMRLVVEGDRVTAAAFEGRGCALSRASASLWSELAHGCTPAELRARLETFARFVAEPVDAPVPAELGELAALAGVRAVKARRGCATLPSRALAAALLGE
ncbi:MAG: SUF system NifU family Fe-S cluster assembly protein [Kofleriaceae bacterium]